MPSTKELVNCPNSECMDGRIQNICSTCNGSGCEPCATCNGAGVVDDLYAPNGAEYSRCKRCGGGGVESFCRDCTSKGYYEWKCGTCSGLGKMPASEAFAILREREEAEKRRQDEQRKKEEERSRQEVEAKKKWEQEAPLREAAERKRKQEAEKREIEEQQRKADEQRRQEEARQQRLGAEARQKKKDMVVDAFVLLWECKWLIVIVVVIGLMKWAYDDSLYRKRQMSQSAASQAEVKLLPPAKDWIKTKVMGTWQGTFDGMSAVLHIADRTDNNFRGSLTIRGGRGTYKIAVKGTLAGGNRLAMQETKVIKQPRNGGWVLGINSGTFGNNEQTMSGIGKAPRQPQYSWTFHR